MRLHHALQALDVTKSRKSVSRQIRAVSGNTARSNIVTGGTDGRVDVRRVTHAPHPALHDLPLDDRARSFAEAVMRSLTVGMLTYSSRTSLVRLAGEMGIRQFDANLIIALVQQRMGVIPMLAQASIDYADDEPQQMSPRTIFLTTAIVQAMIIAAIWFVVHIA